VAWQVAAWLQSQGVQIAGLVVHPPEKRSYGDELIASSGVSGDNIFDGSTLRQPKSLQTIRDLGADLALSVLFGYILKPEFIELFPDGVINLHPSYLPYNRGAYPNVWSIVDGTPAGTTIHYIDSGIDTGDIIAQRMVKVEPVDTGASLYRKLEQSCVDLFTETWPLIHDRKTSPVPQISTEGTYHRTEDVDRFDEIRLDDTYTARELINLLRARTFPPHRGAYFNDDGRKVYVRSQLLYEEDLNEEIDAANHND
jgi:methionyl-tRNA formyltransferase